MGHEVCLNAADAIESLVHNRYSAIVLDFDLPGAARVAKMARMTPADKRPVVFAMIGSLTGISDTFQAGANFVLYKPLVLDQVVRSLRAAQGFMRSDRRRAHRQKVETLVYLQFGIAAIPALVLDVNEQGLALQAPEMLPTVPEVPLRFMLPGTSHMVEGIGEMVWADDEGRAGIIFTRLNSASKKHLKTWLGKRAPKKAVGRSHARAERSRVSTHPPH